MITDKIDGINPKWEEEVRDRIQSYIWMRKSGREKIGWCSHCGQYIAADKYSVGLYSEFYSAKHNSRIICPECGIWCIAKTEGRMRSYKTINGAARMLFVDVVSRDFVRLRGYYIEVMYNKDDERPDLAFTEMVRYEFKPGEARQAKRMYSDFYGLSDWNECKNITEPWPLSYQGNLIPYDIAGLEDLAGTFLAYLPYGEFIDREYPVKAGYYGYQNYTNRVPWAKILSCAARYPMFELCVKAGMWDIIYDLICFNTKNARYLNWDASTPKKFFRKVPTADAKKLMHETDIINVLKFYRRMTQNADKAVTYANAFQYDFLKNKARELGDPPKQIADYLIRQKQKQGGLQLLIDYRNSAVQLGRDINVPSIRFPKNLVLAHDEYHAAAEALRREKEKTVEKLIGEKYPETRENYRRLYEYQRGEYIAMVPPLLSDIRLEGEYQHHCVAGYIDRHAKGKTIIIFIRRVMYPAIPLYTAEISPTGTLRQVQGYHNEDKNKPTPDAYEFIYSWLAEIQKRLAAEAKKQKTEEKTA